jgi:hypothetical protein
MSFKTSCQFVSSFEQWNFISNGILKGKEIDNPIYCVEPCDILKT